eukprot:jgi/Bigna1/64957/fgenesh1_kg.91_\
MLLAPPSLALGTIAVALYRVLKRAETYSDSADDVDTGGESWEQMRLANERNWDERVKHHIKPCATFYADCLKRISEGKQVSSNHKSNISSSSSSSGSCITAIDREALGPHVQGKSLLHLQCHFGLDTLSWIREGASEVVGLDFSRTAIEKARNLSKELKIPAEFVVSDVYNAEKALCGRQFDVVFTGVGAICWLPDIRAWAKQVSKVLADGGIFYIRDGHPMLNALADDDTPGYDDRKLDEKGGQDLLLAYPYFETKSPMVFDSGYTYTAMESNERLCNTRTYEWNHSLFEIIQALIDAGFTIQKVQEHRMLDWKFMESMVKGDDGFYRLPEHQRNRCALMFTIMAQKKSVQHVRCNEKRCL